MRSQNQLLSSRTRVRPGYALLPLEGIPFSRLPHWPGAQVRVLAGPALGAGFAQYMIDLQSSQGGECGADGAIEHFFYVLSGEVSLTVDGRSHDLEEGGFALVPPTSGFSASARSAATLLLLRKRYEPAPGIPMYAPLAGNQAKAPGEVYGGDPGARAGGH